MQDNTPTPTQPTTNLYICPHCGRWQAYSLWVEALAQMGGPIRHYLLVTRRETARKARYAR